MLSPVIIFGIIIFFNIINIIENDFTEFAINTIFVIPVLGNIFHMKLLNFENKELKSKVEIQDEKIKKQDEKIKNLEEKLEKILNK